MCLLEGMIYTSFASGRIERNTMLTTQLWKGQGRDWRSLGLLLSVTDILGGIEVASPRDCIDEVICDYVGTAIIRHNYYYCQRMGNKSLGRHSVTDTLLADAGSKYPPKDHFHSNLIFSWSVFDYQSWDIKYRLEPERCWKLKFTGGALWCPWETTSNAGQMLEQHGGLVPSYKEATTEDREDG